MGLPAEAILRRQGDREKKRNGEEEKRGKIGNCV